MAAVTRRARKVAVVGGGPAGLAACRFLEKFGHQPTVFEISSEVGGIWAPEPANDVVYKGLVTNIPTMCMQSFDLDFPSGLNSYITAPQLGDYMIQYVDHFNLRRFFRFQSRVESVALEGDAWRVTSRALTTTEAVQSESFDAVCVANGHYEFPYLPEIPGETAWLAAGGSKGSGGSDCSGGRRRVVHAVHYDDPEEFRDQSVLIVGGRSSAVDVARELKSITRCLYVLESGCRDITREDHCCRIPMGSSLNPDGTLSYDGQQIAGEAVDTVILATGYTYRYPFLDEEGLGLDFGPTRRYVAPLYQHVIHAKHDSRCFMGVPLAVPCPLPLFEAQGFFVASHLSQPFTTETTRLEWVQKQFASVPRSQDVHFLSGNLWDHLRSLLKEAGLADSDLAAYARRLSLVQAIYEDRGRRRPQLPWEDDAYRRCQYQADYNALRYTVTLPDGSREEGSAKL